MSIEARLFSHRIKFHATLILVSAVAVGCARATIMPAKAVADPARPSRPEVILVRDFAVAPEDVKESHGLISETERKFSKTPERQRELEIGRAAARELSTRLTGDLRGLGFKVSPLSGKVPAEGDFIAVTGEFLDVDEGAAMRRVVIGFGAGKSTLDSRVRVYRVANGSRQELLRFSTHADSGKIPGSALLAGAGVAATGGVGLMGAAASGATASGKAYLGRVNYLADKTADQVSAYLSHYFAQQGWISPS